MEPKEIKEQLDTIQNVLRDNIDHSYLVTSLMVTIKAYGNANFALGLDRWLKVEDGLPEDTDYVLATDGVYIDVMHYNVHKRVWGSDTITPTHWMELPKLPQ